VASGPNGVVTAVTAAGRNGGWAFDGFFNATAWERNGSTWTRVPFPSQNNEMVVAAAASSATNVWAFTQEFGISRALRWNGRQWTVMRSFPRAIGGAVVLGSSDVWVFGTDQLPGVDLGAWHYSGGHLTQAALPGGPSRITVDTVALIPGTTELLGGGDTHGAGNPGTDVTGVVLQYGA
jgi:hypothetical protein